MNALDRMLQLIDSAAHHRPDRDIVYDALRRHARTLAVTPSPGLHQMLVAVDGLRYAIETGELGEHPQRLVALRTALTDLIDAFKPPVHRVGGDGPRYGV